MMCCELGLRVGSWAEVFDGIELDSVILRRGCMVGGPLPEEAAELRVEDPSYWA
jgi:hypothetical protein